VTCLCLVPHTPLYAMGLAEPHLRGFILRKQQDIFLTLSGLTANPAINADTTNPIRATGDVHICCNHCEALPTPFSECIYCGGMVHDAEGRWSSSSALHPASDLVGPSISPTLLPLHYSGLPRPSYPPMAAGHCSVLPAGCGGHAVGHCLWLHDIMAAGTHLQVSQY